MTICRRPCLQVCHSLTLASLAVPNIALCECGRAHGQGGRRLCHLCCAYIVLSYCRRGIRAALANLSGRARPNATLLCPAPRLRWPQLTPDAPNPALITVT